MALDGKIAVLGDSHVNFFGGSEKINFLPIEGLMHLPGGGVVNCGDLTENFVTYRLGACLAYNIARYGTLNAAREKIDAILTQNLVQKGDTMMFVFGEIDIRAHVYKEAKKQGKPVEVIIDGILDNYLGFLQTLTKDYVVWTWGPSAAQADTPGQEDKYIEFGTEEERNKAILIFNSRLKERGAKIGIKHFSIAHNIIDEKLKTRTNFLADTIHLSQRAWLFALPEFKKAGLDVRFKEKWWNRNVTPNNKTSDEDLFRTAVDITNHFNIDFIKNMRSHLKVYDMDSALINIGNLAAPLDILTTNAAFSFSHNKDMAFEKNLANYNIPVFFQRSENPEEEHQNLRQLAVNLVGVKTANEKDLTLLEIINGAGLKNYDNLALRLDISGYEYEVLSSISSELLKKFKFINVKLNHLTNQGAKDKILFALDKLNATHALINVWANANVPYMTGDGKILPTVLEATYVLRSAYKLKKSERFFPSETDAGLNSLNLGYWG